MKFKIPTTEQREYNNYLNRHKRKQNKGAYGTKDSEQGKVYAAEHKAEGGYLNDRLVPLEEVQGVVDKIVNSKTYRKQCTTDLYYSRVNVEFCQSSRFGGIAWCHRRLVKFSTKKRSFVKMSLIVHELAHMAGHMHHGRTFRNANLALVARFIGKEEADRLKMCYRENKLQLGKGRAPASFEVWKAKRDRIRYVREDRMAEAA